MRAVSRNRPSVDVSYGSRGRAAGLRSAHAGHLVAGGPRTPAAVQVSWPPLGGPVRHVLEELQPAVERPAGDHFEAHVRISVVDPLPPGAAVDDWKTTTRKRSTRPASSNDRHNVRLPIVRNGPAPSSFIDRTASTGSWSTTPVLAHTNGFFSVEENTTFGHLGQLHEAGVVGRGREVRHQPVRGRAHQGPCNGVPATGRATPNTRVPQGPSSRANPPPRRTRRAR